MAADRLYDVTRSACPSCRCLVQARIVGREGRIVMESHCAQHGITEALVSSDERLYLEALSTSKPGSVPRRFARPVERGCPDDCGFCPEHEQHVCMPVIEITDRCDLACPVCIVDNRGAHEMSFDTFRQVVDGLLQAEPSIQILNLSGGEPTLHSRYREFLQHLVSLEGILRVSVSTNGLSLDRDPELRALHRSLDVVTSLQLDGFSEETYRVLRGRPELAATKRRLIDTIVAENLPASLTVTLVRGVNELELGSILDLYLSHDNLLSLTIQPFTHEGQGRRFSHDPMTRLTIPDVLRLIEEGSAGRVRASDFGPLPCCHPACFYQTFLLKAEGGGWLPLRRVFPPREYSELIRNRSYMNPSRDGVEQVKDLVYRLWAEPGQEPERVGALKTIKRLIREIDSEPGASPRRTARIVERRKKSIFIHQFMDAETFDVSRVRRCCSVYATEDGRIHPMCVYNVLRRQAGAL